MLQPDQLQRKTAPQIPRIVQAQLRVGRILGVALDLDPVERQVRPDERRREIVVRVILQHCVLQHYIHPEHTPRQRRLIGGGHAVLRLLITVLHVRSADHRAVRPDDLARPETGSSKQGTGQGDRKDARLEHRIPVAPHAGQLGLRRALARLGPVARHLHRAGEAAGLLQDDVGHDGLALHVHAGRAPADHVDALNLRRRHAREQSDQVVGLAGRPLAVDQHIARRPREPAHLRPVVKGEPRQAQHHVVGRHRVLRRKIGRGVAEHPVGLVLRQARRTERQRNGDG